MQTEHTADKLVEKNLFESHGGKSKLIFSSPRQHPSGLKFDSRKDISLII